MTKVIGIVSYLPNDNKIRTNRWNKLVNLISTCNKLFELKIFIEAQCWSPLEIHEINSRFSNVTIYYNQDKLGIVGARRKLREHFLQSSYDVLIMLDDDCELKGTKEEAIKYLQQIDDNPNMFYEHNGTLLKLFAISKDIFKEVDFEDVNPENGEGFEDRVFVNKLRNLFPEKKYTFVGCRVFDCSISTKDVNSTWYTNQDVKKMLENTSKFLEEHFAKLK